MNEIKEMYQTADWKKEKHVPVIDAPGTVKKDETFDVSAGIGKEIAHPNTAEHHISWIELFFLPSGEKYPYLVGRCEFAAHGSSVEGPSSGTVYSHHATTFKMRTGKPGTLMAASYCNIHGLWSNSTELKVE